MIFEGFDFYTENISLNELEFIPTKAEYNFKKKHKEIAFYSLINFKQELAYDKKSDTHFSSNEAVYIDVKSGVELACFHDESENIYYIIALKGSVYQELKLIVTNTRIISIETIKEKRKPLKRHNDRVILTAYELDEKIIPVKYQIKKNVRGGTSRAYEKKSYTIKSLDKNKISIFDLPMNKKYVLNSLYEDEYKIRDVLSWNIWTESSAYQNERGIFNSTEMLYVELFIDDSYEGMYGIQDHVNEDKLHLDKTNGTIYEMFSYEYPELDRFNEYKDHWGGIQITQTTKEEGKAWYNFYDVMKSFSLLPETQHYIDEHVDISSFIDYFLFVELVTGADNFWKNIYLSITEDTGKLMITPWDLDQTFGLKWTGEQPYLTHTYFGGPWMVVNYPNNSFEFLMQLKHLHSDFYKNAARRYFELRQDLWTEERIMAKITEYQVFLSITGIYDRDMQRWPNSPTIIPGKENFILENVIEKIHLMDEEYAKVLAGD